MRRTILSRLVAPVSAPVARQLSLPRGWFGRVVTTRVLNRGNRDLIQATLGALPLGPETRLLDVGFGGGLLLELAARRGLRFLSGLDPSDAAIRALRERHDAAFAGAELRIAQGTVEAMPFDDGSFDAVASTNTVYFWPDAVAAFAELRRVLRPGGALALGFSGAAKLRAFDAITQHGFHFHENGHLLAFAERAGLREARLVELHGKRTEGDWLLVARR